MPICRLSNSLQKVGAPWSLTAKTSIFLDSEWSNGPILLTWLFTSEELSGPFHKALCSSESCLSLQMPTSGHRSLESKSFAQRNPKLPMSPTALGVLWTLVMWWRPVFMFLYPSLLFWVTVFSCVYLISHGWQNSWFQFPALHLKRQA